MQNIGMITTHNKKTFNLEKGQHQSYEKLFVSISLWGFSGLTVNKW